MTTTQPRRKKRKEDHLATDYINNAQFQKDLLDYYSRTDDIVPNNVCMAVMQICGRLATKYNFSGYSYIDEMESAGIERCFKALREKKYNPYKYSNPFAYFTTVAYYEFLRVLNDEHRESYIKHASLVNLHQEMSLDPEAYSDIAAMTSTDDINWALVEKFAPKPRAKKGAAKTNVVDLSQKEA